VCDSSHVHHRALPTLTPTARAATAPAHVRASAYPASRLYRPLPSHPSTLRPSGDQWWHEIKHDGIRVIARKEDKRVKLYNRPGNDLTHRFPQIVEGLSRLRSRSCIIDGEAVP
jgi:ATP-dependent DNA ligase